MKRVQNDALIGKDFQLVGVSNNSVNEVKGPGDARPQLIS